MKQKKYLRTINTRQSLQNKLHQIHLDLCQTGETQLTIWSLQNVSHLAIPGPKAEKAQKFSSTRSEEGAGRGGLQTVSSDKDSASCV